MVTPMTPDRPREVSRLFDRRSLLRRGGTFAVACASARLVPGVTREARAAVPDDAASAEDLIGAISYYVTDSQNTLLDVARRHDLGILEISAANPGVDAWVPGEERAILLPTAHLLPEVPREGIVVNLAELRLYLFRGESVETHAIGIGRDGFATPMGPTTVVRKTENPVWRPTAATRIDKPELPASVPAGPDNPLGAHAIYLGWPTYLIHGTNKPYGVGRRVSRGCIRMYPEAVADLFTKVQPSMPVRVIAEPIKLGWSNGDLYLEAHPDIAQLDQLEDSYAFTPHPTSRPPESFRRRLLDKAGDAAGRIDWDIVDAELTDRRGIPVRITRAATATTIADNEAKAGDPGTPGRNPGKPAISRPFTGLY
ncbi:MAG: L,D-transpeptidase family protein [Geminicoccaceae bacterium]|nr:L,D-transpeptidase family protein [Geminicoccaceae bacterium]